MLERSVFERVPARGGGRRPCSSTGTSASAADPVALLDRVFTLLRPGGEVLVETLPPGHCDRSENLQFEIDGVAGPWFAWSVVGADDLPALAAGAACDVVQRWNAGTRWFGALRRG